MGIAAEFWSWWSGELAGLLPGSSAGGAGRRLDALVLELGRDTVRLGRIQARSPDELHELGRFDRAALRAEPEAESGRLAELARRHFKPRSMKLEVWLPRDSALTRSVRLPLAAEENLRGVLGFEMERLTPFKAEDVYFEGRVLAKEISARQMQVELAVAPCRIVDEALSLVPEARARIDRERIEFRTRDDGVAVGFLPPERGARASPLLGGALVVVNLALLGAVILVPLDEQESALAGLQAEVKIAREAAARANAVQSQIDAMRAQLARITAQKAAQPAVVQVVEELAQRLPDSTWIYRLDLRDSTVQISGSSQSASGLIELLEGSELFADTRFVSPVTQERGSERERFHISARILNAPALVAGEG